MTVWFKDRTVLVTGGGSGIGRSAALRFAEEGARVCVADLDGTRAEAVVRQIVAAGGHALSCTADVSIEADNERMVDVTVQHFGGLDIAFLNAGMGGIPMDVLEGDLALFDRIIDTNLRGTLLGVRSVNRRIRSGGAIVVTASLGSVIGIGFNPAYAAAKHGVLGLVRSLAHHFGQRGVRINAVCPGSVATAMIGRTVDDLDVGPDALPHVAPGKRAHPQHIAEIVLFLASQRAADINGAAIMADAGQTVDVAPPRVAR